MKIKTTMKNRKLIRLLVRVMMNQIPFVVPQKIIKFSDSTDGENEASEAGRDDKIPSGDEDEVNSSENAGGQTKINSGREYDINSVTTGEGNNRINSGGGNDYSGASSEENLRSRFSTASIYINFFSSSGKVNCSGEDLVTLENSSNINVSKNCGNVQT